MVSAAGAGATSVARYVLRLQGEQDSSVPRVFGRVSKSVQSVDDELRSVRDTLKQQRAELRNVAKGSEEYDKLSNEVKRTERNVDRLTDELNEQQRAWGRLTDRRRQFGNITRTGALAIAGAVTGLLLYAESAGEAAQQLLAVERETGLATEAIQRLQQQAKAAGVEIDPRQFRRISTRLGEIQHEALLAEQGLRSFGAAGESLLPASTSLKQLGLDARQVASKDIPLIIERIGQVEDVSLRAALANNIFGRQVGGAVVSITELDQATRDLLATQLISTHTQLEQYSATRIELQKLKNDFGEVTSAVAQGLLPAITGVTEAITPFVQTAAVYAEENPRVIQAIAATGIAVVGLTSLMWLLNTALAVRAALSGPAGWAALGVALAVTGASAVLGATAFSAGRDIQEQNAEEAREQTRQGTYEGHKAAASEDRDSLTQTLTNILPDRGCPPEELISRAALASVQEVIDNNIGAPFPLVPPPIARRNLEDTRRNVAIQQQEALGVPDEAFRVPTSALDTYELQQRAELLAYRRRLQGDADAPTVAELRELNDRESAITRQEFRELARERANTTSRVASTPEGTVIPPVVNRDYAAEVLGFFTGQLGSMQQEPPIINMQVPQIPNEQRTTPVSTLQSLNTAELSGLINPLPPTETTEGDHITYNVNQTNNIETTETAEVVTDELVDALEDARFGR